MSAVAMSGVATSMTPLNTRYYLLSVPNTKLEEFDAGSAKLEKQRVNFAAKTNVKAEKKQETTLNLKDRKMVKNDAEKDDIINSMQVNEYTTIIRRLSGDMPFTVPSGTYTIRTRHSSTNENEYAAEYIYEYLKALGYNTYYENFRCQSGYNTQNIIGVKRGSSLPNEVVVVGGHMDSTSPQTSNAPGAIDNASGSDGMMLIAKAFQNTTLARTVFFMAFGCEEQGLIGSEYFIENTDENVVSALTMDMIAYSNDHYGVMIEGLPNPDIQVLMELMEENCNEYSPELTTTSRNFSFGSDHVSFQNAGVPAFLAIEQDETDYMCYHATCDQFQHVNSNMGTDIAKGMAGVLYDVAKTQ
jgi:Zn-dependent M28 family amino/carboxypeptidase